MLMLIKNCWRNYNKVIAKRKKIHALSALSFKGALVGIDNIFDNILVYGDALGRSVLHTPLYKVGGNFVKTHLI